jgi:phosphoglycolate phosphatase
MPSILVTFGPSGDDMAALQPEGMINHYSELMGEVRRLIGPA